MGLKNIRVRFYTNEEEENEEARNDPERLRKQYDEFTRLNNIFDSVINPNSFEEFQADEDVRDRIYAALSGLRSKERAAKENPSSVTKKETSANDMIKAHIGRAYELRNEKKTEEEIKKILSDDLEAYKKQNKDPSNNLKTLADFQKYVKEGERQMTQWVAITRDFMAMVATNSHTSLRSLDIRYELGDQDDDFYKESINVMHIVRGLDEIGNEPWRFEVVSRRYQISIKSDFVKLQMLLEDWYGKDILKKCFKTIYDTLLNDRESVIFARYVGQGYTATHQPRYVKLNTMVQDERELETKFAIDRYITQIL